MSLYYDLGAGLEYVGFLLETLIMIVKNLSSFFSTANFSPP